MKLYDPTDGAASMLQTIERLKGNTLTADQAKTKVASNVKTSNAKVKPGEMAVQELAQYIAKHYPDGKIPANLREAVTLAQKGGINDMGIAARVQADIGDRTRGTGSGAETDPLGAAAKIVNSPNPRLAQYYGYDMPAFLGDTLSAPVDLAKAQDAERLGPTGPGIFGPILALANPAAGALFSMGQGAREGNPLQAFGSLAGLGATQGAFDNILNDLGGGGFKNPEALNYGKDAAGLYSPESLGKAATEPGTVRGFEGLSSSSLYRPESLTGAWSAFDFAPRPGLEGLKPSQLYNPESLGGPGKTPDWTKALDALDFLPGGGGKPATGGIPSAPVTNVYQPGPVPYTFQQGPQTLYPGFFGGEPDLFEMLGNKPGVGHGTRAGAAGNVLSRAQPMNVYT